ncbi:hypothetical protein HMPREF0322_02356 [Desulfitobacterium hafniense DP7]|uniref:Uncharacterized protein n=1 Tax=Desulfitobacterium hafniense DP7 TaxID=537010 RepID=G9XN15_DESHA|nr:hypothetical protein HMPREF0322_02356 [Desulfitobacterium hafniense DP7]
MFKYSREKFYFLLWLNDAEKWAFIRAHSVFVPKILCRKFAGSGVAGEWVSHHYNDMSI